VFRWLKRVATLVAVALVVSIVGITAFIGTRCYGSAPAASPAAPPPGVDGYHRSEAFTFLTLPEWFIVFSADEYASFVRRQSPSEFPFLRSAAQYWTYYGAVCDATHDSYAFETGYHVMLGVIGLSQTAEYALKALYEGSIGRLSSWLFTHDTAEDRFAASLAAEYGAFMHETPWYRFPFIARLRTLWAEVPLLGPHPGRKWERRVALTAELAFKGSYGWVMGLGSQAAYGAEDLTTYARVTGGSSAAVQAAGGRILSGGEGGAVVALPRYERFTPAALRLLDGGARFSDVAGNDEILVTVLAGAEVVFDSIPGASVVARKPLPTDTSRNRVALRVAVTELGDAVRRLTGLGASMEHLYDY
jgi:hypothetical protein